MRSWGKLDRTSQLVGCVSSLLSVGRHIQRCRPRWQNNSQTLNPSWLKVYALGTKCLVRLLLTNECQLEGSSLNTPTYPLRNKTTTKLNSHRSLTMFVIRVCICRLSCSSSSLDPMGCFFHPCVPESTKSGTANAHCQHNLLMSMYRSQNDRR